MSSSQMCAGMVEAVIAGQEWFKRPAGSDEAQTMSDDERAYWVPRVEELYGLGVRTPEEIRAAIHQMIMVEVGVTIRLHQGEPVMCLRPHSDGFAFELIPPTAVPAQRSLAESVEYLLHAAEVTKDDDDVEAMKDEDVPDDMFLAAVAIFINDTGVDWGLTCVEENRENILNSRRAGFDAVQISQYAILKAAEDD